MKKEISSSEVAQAPHVLSQAVEANGLVFVSGMIGADKEWNIVSGGVEEELTQSMKFTKQYNILYIFYKKSYNDHYILCTIIYKKKITQYCLRNKYNRGF